jgi:hypothetical protein
MMLEFFAGVVLGTVVTTACAMIDCHRHKVKRRVQLEQEYVKLQECVDGAVVSIERIIEGGTP